MFGRNNMSSLNIGYNFSQSTFDLIEKMNDSNGENRIGSVYGSDIEHHEFSARPLYRFPEGVTLDVLIDHALKLKQIGVKFWYTSNTISAGGKDAIDEDKFLALARRLGSNDIGMIIADTMLLEILKKNNVSVDVELSTILRIESPRQLIALSEQYPFITKMVMHISYNRSFYVMRQFVIAGASCGIEIEVLCNELCGSGYSEGATPCIHRDRCYSLHGTTETLEEAKSFSNYPFNRCVGNRYSNVNTFMNLFWILPQDFHYYEFIGIRSFKLTGRTASDKFMSTILPMYIDGKYEGDISKLWKSIESINSSKNEAAKIKTLDASDVHGFLRPFSTSAIECHTRLCGIDCNYCKEFAEGIK